VRMIGNLLQVSDEKIDALIDAPDQITYMLYGPPPKKQIGFLGRLFGKREPADDTPREEWSPPPEDETCYLDKAWHGLHYLFTDSDWDGDEPLCFLVKGGDKIGEVDVGYGPARSFRSEQVKATHGALAGIEADDLRNKYKPEQMDNLDIYPSIWREEPGDDPLGYLLEYFSILKEFITVTANKDLGILVYIN
jgi:hypothetical protein